MDYLLGISDDLRGNEIVTYKEALQGLINTFEKNLVEFDDETSDTTRFFYIKISNDIVIDFLSKYKKY